MVRSYACIVSFYFSWLSLLFSSLRIFLIFVGVLFGFNIKRTQKSIFIGQKYFCEVMIVDSMDCFFLIFVVLIQLEGFCKGILVK